jgi:hypothetical protein
MADQVVREMLALDGPGTDTITPVSRVEPKHKGVGFAAIVKGLKASAKAAAAVPEAQRGYLSGAILPSGWYPERDYNVLLITLADSVDRNAVGDVWAYFGRTAARRDVAGDQEAIPASSRTENAGVYRNFRAAQPNDVAGLCLRLAKIWSMYHDTGRVVFTRHARKSNVVVAKLHDFSFPVRGMADLQTAFSMEFAQLSGLELTGSLERFEAGAPSCEWHYQVAATPEALSSLASLSPDVA